MRNHIMWESNSTSSCLYYFIFVHFCAVGCTTTRLRWNNETKLCMAYILRCFWLSEQIFPRPQRKLVESTWMFFLFMIQKPCQSINPQPPLKLYQLWACKPQNVWEYRPKKQIAYKFSIQTPVLLGILSDRLFVPQSWSYSVLVSECWQICLLWLAIFMVCCVSDVIMHAIDLCIFERLKQKFKIADCLMGDQKHNTLISP